MQRLLPLLLLLPIVASGATLHEAEYGKAATFDFLLYNTDGTLDVDEVDGGAEVSVSCDEGAEGTATNDFSDEGTFYSIVLTAAEMACARVSVVVAATDTNVFFVETYGHPSAQNACGDQPCITSGTAQASAASTIVLAAATSFADAYLVGATVTIVEGTGSGQTRVCSGWTSSSDTCTVSENWTTTPSTDSDYLVYRTRFATLSVDASGRVDVGSVAGTAQTANDIGADTNSILADTGTDGVAIADGAIDAGAIANDAIDADSTAADYLAEINAEVDTALVDIGLDHLVVIQGTADSGTTATIVDAALTQVENYWHEDYMAVIAFAGGPQARCVTAFTASSDTLTLKPNLETAVTTEDYVLIPMPCFIRAEDVGNDAFTASTFAADSIGESEIAADAIGASEIATDAIDADALADDGTAEIWAVSCEDQGSGYSCREAMSMLLSEAIGTCTYTSGTRTWVCKDPSGTETRFTIVYGSELDGDRTSSTPAPMTP